MNYLSICLNQLISPTYKSISIYIKTKPTYPTPTLPSNTLTMRQFKRIFKPLLATTIIGAGGYYFYDSIMTKNLPPVEPTLSSDPQILPKSIPSLLQQQEQQNHTHQQKEKLDLQKQESREGSDQGKTVNKQNQEVKKQSEVKENTNVVKAQDSNSSDEKIPQPQPTSEAMVASLQKEIAPQQKPNQPLTPINLSKLTRLSQLPQLPIKPKSQLKTILVVADMGYTPQFQQKLLQTIKSLKKLPDISSIQIYRANASNPQSLEQISHHYGHKIKQQTIFLLKNELQDNFVDISFDMYMQYPTLISTYLSKLNLYNEKNQQDYMKRLQKMSPNESYLMFVYDDSQTPQKRAKALLAAKYVQMELAFQHLDQAIKVMPIEATVARNYKLIPEDKIRSKSLHIIRKHNEFTHVAPNLHLNFNPQQHEITPFHLLPDIGLHNKRGQVVIQQYLQKIQTFNSLSITTPYLLSLTIDKNRISTQNYKKLMETFKQLKRKNKFPEVSIALKFSQIGYLGRDYQENGDFCIKMANVAELENQSAMHQVANLEDAKNMGITQENWLKNSYEFLYPHQAISQELIQGFIDKVLLNEVHQYYRSDKPSSIQNVHKIVASNFDQQIIQNPYDHFVFQYSDHCPSCKLISPLIGYMNDILTPIPIQQRFDIHILNCHKNRVRNQVYSPYTPNMNYFKNEWKHSGPVRIGLETIKYGGLEGLYNFCVITNMLKTIDGKKFAEAIQAAKGWDRKDFLV